MHFYFSRRHRRSLLLPPGLLALAGLLLLGCLALRPWQQQLKRHNVIELTMPIYVAHPTLPMTIRFLLPDPDTMCERRFRHDAFLNGKAAHDQRQFRQIKADSRLITADTKHNGLVCVRLAPTARYANMVALLDLTERMSYHKYWFDFKRKPAAFYIFSSRAVHSSPALSPYECLTGRANWSSHAPLPTPPTFLYRFNAAVAKCLELQWLTPLRQPEWRVPLALLALVFLLNGWRLLGRMHVARAS